MLSPTENTLAVFNGIQSKVTELAQYTDEFSRLMSGRALREPKRVPIPSVWYSECHVHCGRWKVPMNLRPLLFKLFKAFIDAPDNTLGRNDLLATIYPVVVGDDVSKRMTETYAHNLVKLLGRGRALAEQELNEGRDMRWFVYDLRSGSWRLRDVHHLVH